MSDSCVVHFANTFISRPGNIGVRTGQLIAELSPKGVRFRTVTRGVARGAPASEYIGMGALGHLPRVLNGIRNRLLPNYNHRFIDIGLFEWFAQQKLGTALRDLDRPVAHVWDTCPRLIESLKALGIPVVLDVPIAPATYSQRMARSGKAPFMLDDTPFIRLEHKAHLLADVLLAPSTFVRDELILSGVPEHAIEVIPFGAPGKAPVSITPQDAATARPLRFCFVGAISRRKGLAELLEAWQDPALARHELHLCGRISKDGQTILGQCARSNVVTPGFVDTARYLASCDVFVLPSWMEGSSKAVYEAMRAGLPCLVTHSTGSVVRHGIDGFVIDAGDVDALRRHLCWFAEHSQETRVMGAAAQEQAGVYSVFTYAQKVLEVYRRCAKEYYGSKVPSLASSVPSSATPSHGAGL